MGVYCKALHDALPDTSLSSANDNARRDVDAIDAFMIFSYAMGLINNL